MEKLLATLRDYAGLADTQINLADVVVDSLLLIVMSLAVSWLYVTTARTLSNRKRLAALLPVLALTTMMIITIVKSSLALSLGLVGALSIVRFRSAIKEPEELVYIFLAIGLGLGMGASQRATSIVFFVIVFVFILLEAIIRQRTRIFDLSTDSRLLLSIVAPQTIDLDAVINTLDPYTRYLELKRSDSGPDQNEVLFVLKLNDHKQLSALQTKLQKQYPAATVVIMNDEKLFA